MMVSLLLIIPLAAAFLTALAGKLYKGLAEALAVAASFGLFAVSLFLAITMSTGKVPVVIYNVGGWLPPAGIPMVVDGLSALMLVTMNFVGFMVAIYAVGYMKKYTDTWKFFTLFTLMLAGINGVLAAGDIFNLYVFLEIAAISGYFLVAFGTQADELEAAFKYAVMGTVASAFIFLGIAFLYSYTSTLNMAGMASAIAANGNSAKVVKFAAVLFLAGFGLKAALAPFHSWLPYAHSSAPAPVSAMLSGVVIKVLGVYALTRIFFNVFGMTTELSIILIALALLSMIGASILAFGQSDIKRLFAYSSISQIGYIALGLGVGTPLAIFGALFHLVNHSVFKSLLFMNSGAIERITGTRDLNKISGVVSASPVTGYTGLVGAFSICGVPPLGGFWSKLIIILACILAGHPVLAFIAVAVSVMTLAYYFKALSPAFFGQRPAPAASRGRISPSMAVAMVILAVVSMAGFIVLLPNPANALIKGAAAVVLGGREYAAIVMGNLR